MVSTIPLPSGRRCRWRVQDDLVETGIDDQASGGDRDISLNRLAVCECSDFNVCFVLEPFGVSDGSLSLHVERA